MTSPILDSAIVGGNVVIPGDGVRQLTVGIIGERIASLTTPEIPVDAKRIIDATGKYVLPGVIDPHVHIGYSGYQGMPIEALSSHFDTESASAVVGGVTSIVVTYRNGSTYDTLFDEMRSAGENNSRIDFAYSLGITNDDHVDRIGTYYRDLGVTSFKFYMAYRGEEAKATGNVYNRYDDGLLYVGMEQIAEIPGGMAMVHPENVEVINRLRDRLRKAGRDGLDAWTDSRPAFTEAENVRRAAYLGEQVNCPVYIPHLSSAKALDAALEHRARQTNPIYLETCPQYLTHTKHSVSGSLAKVNPPVREQDDLDRLWAATRAGHIDSFGTDHCGVTRDVKGGDIWSAVPGFSGMATMLPVLLQGVVEGRLDILTVAEVTSYNTARLFGLAPRKGTIAIGSDADLVVVDLNLTRQVDPVFLRSRSDFSIYEGQSITGWPTLTLVRGVVAFDGSEVTAEPGHGRYLFRGGQPAATPPRSL